jgi:hypothetical protein
VEEEALPGVLEAAQAVGEVWVAADDRHEVHGRQYVTC